MPDLADLIAQLYAQRGMQTMADSNEQTGAILAQLKAQRENPVAQVSEQDNMPVFKRNDELNRAVASNDISADLERGNAINPQRLQGLGPADIGQAYNQGNMMRAYGGDPMSQYMEPNQRANQQGLVYKPDQHDPVAGRIERARLLDEATQLNGGQMPADYLQGKPVTEALQNLVDQLNARREKLGANALGAWGATFSEPI